MTDVYKIVGNTGGSGGGSAETFSLSFDATTSWGSAVGGFYTIAIPQTTHNKSVTPIVETYEDIGGGDFDEVETEVIISSAGDVTLRVTENIDARFAGKIVII
jgi:hypothetical protein